MKTIINPTKRYYHLQTLQEICESKKHVGLSWKSALIVSTVITSAIYLSSCKAKSDTFTEVAGVTVKVSPNTPMKEPLGVLIDRVATEENLHPSLAFALVRAESNFNPNALSETNAVGLTQVLRSTACSEFGICSLAELAVPETNLRTGFRYLKKLQAKHKKLNSALIAYNIGAKNMLNPKQCDPIKYQKAVKYANGIITEFVNNIS